MPRKNLIRQNQYPYHVFIRSNNKDWFKIPLLRMWEICYECLLYAKNIIPVEIHCFVLMSNHYHLLITTPQSDLDKYMELFNRRLSQRIKRFVGAENHKFANRYKWTIVDSETYLMHIYRYIYQNPVRANLCRLCIDYPYSSLRFSNLQKRELKIKVHISYFKNRIWMEERHGSDFDSLITSGLGKQAFEVRKSAHKYLLKKINEKPL